MKKLIAKKGLTVSWQTGTAIFKASNLPIKNVLYLSFLISNQIAKSKFMLAIAVTLFLSVAIINCKENNLQPQKSEVANTPANKDTLESQAWHMEEQCWKYAANNDTVSYKTLWHYDFIGYPSFGTGVSNKSGIAAWIPELHKDTSLTYSYQLSELPIC